MTRVVVRPRAEADVDEIAQTIAANNLPAALRFYEAVDQTYDFLRDHMQVGSGRVPRNRRLAGLRSYGVIGFGTYLVFFVPSPTVVRVVRVLHGARDLDRIMGPTA